MALSQAIVSTESHTQRHFSEFTDLTGSPINENLPRSAIAIQLIDTAEKYISSFFASEATFHDLLLQIPENIFRSRSVETILRSAARQKRRFTYDREKCVLRLYAMSRPLHDAVSLLVSRFLLKAFTTGFVTASEQDNVSCGTTGVTLSRTVITAAGTKPQAWTKYPDAVILYGPPDSTPIPSVIFEVGFSESYKDLLNDAQQWLERSGGKVQLVVLIDINEDIKTRKSRQNTKEAKQRLKNLLISFGTTIARENEGIELDVCETESNPDTYDEIESQIFAEDWVGPIEATLEQWTIENNSLRLRSRIV